MKKVFYILDINGEFLSEDGKKRYKALSGQALYEYLRTEDGKKKYFDVSSHNLIFRWKWFERVSFQMKQSLLFIKYRKKN